MNPRDIPAQIGDLPPVGRPAHRALPNVGITSLAEVASLGRRELLALHGVGPKALRILEAAAAERGLVIAP